MEKQESYVTIETRHKQYSRKRLIIGLSIVIVIVVASTIGISLFFYFRKPSTPTTPTPTQSAIDTMVDTWLSKLNDDCSKIKDIKDEIKKELKDYIKKYPDDEKNVQKILEFNEMLFNFYMNNKDYNETNGYNYLSFYEFIRDFNNHTISARELYDRGFKNRPEIWSILMPLPEPHSQFPGNTMIICIWKMIRTHSNQSTVLMDNFMSIETFMSDLQERHIFKWFTDKKYAYFKKAACRFAKFYLGNDVGHFSEGVCASPYEFFKINHPKDCLYNHLDKNEKQFFDEAIKIEKWLDNDDIYKSREDEEEEEE